MQLKDKENNKRTSSASHLAMVFALASIVSGLLFGILLEFFRNFELPARSQIKQLVTGRLKEKTT